MREGRDLASPIWCIWAAESLLQLSKSLYSKVSLTQCLLDDSLVTHLLPPWQPVLKPFTRCFWFPHLHTSLSALHHPKGDPLQDLVCGQHFPLSKLACLGFQSAEARNRKLWDCHCCALCAMQLSHRPAEGRGTDWRLAGAGMTSDPQVQPNVPGQDARIADNQHLWAQECGQTELGNQLG